MTCIIGYIDHKENCTWMGCDSLGSDGYTKAVEGGAKAFHHNVFKNIVMGSTTTFRHIDLLKYSKNLFPEVDWYKGTKIDHKYMVETFIPNLITLFQTGLICMPEQKRGGNFLLGVNDKLFEVQSDYSVLEPQAGFASVGCGKDVAMGSLITTTTYFSENLSPKEHIQFALEAAEKNCCGVQRPFRIINTKNEEEIMIK